MLSNVEVRNVFYELNSLVGLKPIWGLVTITNSVFERISICGAVVKNTLSEVSTPQIGSHANSDLLSDAQREHLIKKAALEN